MDLLALDRGASLWQALGARRQELLRRVVMGVLLGVPLAYALIQSAWSAVGVEAPGFVSQQQLSIGTPHAGRVAEVFVRASQDVSAGDALVRLVDENLLVRAAQLREQLGDAAADLTAAPRDTALQAELDAVEQRRQALIIRAPKSGRVAGVEVLAGDHLAAGREVVRLTPTAAETHIDAWVSQRHADLAERGAPATVVFADGGQRQAQVVAVPESAHPLPAVLAGSFGRRQPGVLVRLDFMDDPRAATPPVANGARVKVRFSEPRRERWLSKVQDWFGAKQGANPQGRG